MLTIVWDVDDVLNGLMQTWFTESWKPAPTVRETPASLAHFAEAN